MVKDYYQILGVNRDATPEQIKNAYKKLVLKWHPDRPTPAGYSKKQQEEKFKEIKEARDFLLNQKDSDKNNLDGEIEEILAELARMSAKNQFDMIQTIEKAFILYGVSSADLDAGLWSGYRDWKEKLEKLAEMPVVEVPTEFVKFHTQLFDKIVEVGKAKGKSRENKGEEERENLKREEEKLRRQQDYYQSEEIVENIVDITLFKGKVGDKIIAKFRSEGVSDSDLDSSLWSPHHLWAEKLVSLKSIGEVESFKNRM